MFSKLLELFLGDETRHWPPAELGPLTLDVSARSINGVRLGEPFDRIRALGRPGNPRPIRQHAFFYLQAGLNVCIEQGRVSDIEIAIGPDPSHFPFGMQPARTLTLRLNGRSVDLKPGDKLAKVVSSLDIRPEEERDTDEIIARLHLSGTVVEFECLLDGTLEYVNFYLN